MNSPAEVQVNDGDEEAYLWPSPEIRQRAIDTLMKKVELIAEEKLSRIAKEIVEREEKKLYVLAEKVADESKKVEAGLFAPDIDAIKHTVREIGKVLHVIKRALRQTEDDLATANPWDQNKRDVLRKALWEEHFSKNILVLLSKLDNLMLHMQINSDY